MTLAIVLLVSLASGCASRPPASGPVLRVNDVITNAQSLDGKTVRIEAWLAWCVPTACTIFDSKAAAQAWNPTSGTAMLSIASDAKFDRRVAHSTPGNITFEARVNATCISFRGEKLELVTQLNCIGHRPSDLYPIQVLRLSR